MSNTRPAHHFRYLLAMDSETTGLFFGDDPCHGPDGQYHMAISWGFIVLDAETLTEHDRLYVEIKWDGKSEWNDGAEKVHGLSKQYLEENGVSEEDAVVAVGALIMKYWANTPICTLGHNVATFDLKFLRTMFLRHGITLNFGNRHVDTFSIGLATVRSYNSDELFELTAQPERTLHNSMEDIELTVEAVRRIRTVFDLAYQG